MIAYCILGIEHLYGNSLISVTKIYKTFIDKEKALKEFQILKFSGIDNLSINEIEIHQ